jgi:hypothetical protein
VPVILPGNQSNFYCASAYRKAKINLITIFIGIPQVLCMDIKVFILLEQEFLLTTIEGIVG